MAYNDLVQVRMFRENGDEVPEYCRPDMPHMTNFGLRPGTPITIELTNIAHNPESEIACFVSLGTHLITDSSTILMRLAPGQVKRLSKTLASDPVIVQSAIPIVIPQWAGIDLSVFVSKVTVGELPEVHVCWKKIHCFGQLSEHRFDTLERLAPVSL